MAITIPESTDLDVIAKQRSLVEEALSSDGVYIRMKETLEDLLNKGEINGTDRAKVVAETIASMSAQITANAMNTGLQWASAEKELALKKEQMEYELDILAQNKILAENQVVESLTERQLKQAQLRRTYGVPTLDTDGNVTGLTNVGVSYAQEQNTIQDTANKAKLNTQIDSQTEEVQARTHKLVADTYVNHGLFTGYTITNSGISSATRVNTGYVTLSDLNKQVAREQAKGYTYNAWANAASAGASMLGTIAAAEVPEISATTYAELASIWKTPTVALGSLSAPNITI